MFQLWYDIGIIKLINRKKQCTMKKKFAFLFLLLAVTVFFSSCKKDNRPAEIHTDSSKIIFDKYDNTKYFTIVNSGNSSMDFQISTSDAFLNVTPSNGILGFNETAVIQVDVNRDMLGIGLHDGSLLITSNGGTRIMDVQVYNPLPNPPQLWWDIDYIKIPANKIQDYITIANDGEDPLDFNLTSPANWISFSQTSGRILAGEEKIVWVNVDRTGLSSNLYSSVVNINSNGGNGQVVIDMEVNVYSVTFFNPTYTPIEINVSGFSNQIIEVLDRTNFVFPSNPGAISYFARTEGESVNGQTLGLTLTWDESLDLTNENSPIYDLNVSDYFFFLSVKNYGAHDLDMWSINNGSDYQIDEDVLIPNDGYEYNFGYYDAFDNTIIYARIVGTDFDAVWENGVEFDFPWTINQSILLESDQKKSTRVKSDRSFNKTGETQSLVKKTPQKQKKMRVRHSQSLINKRK